MSKEVFVVQRQKDRSGWWIILLAAALIAYWKAVVFACMIAGFYFLARKALNAEKARHESKISRDAAMSMRADYENMMALRGDPVGVHGQHDAYTMPLTRPRVYLPGYSFDDYDDGLENWK